MKTNIFVGIALCLLLCCTLPVAASDYTLGVFGNANEDDTINMQDVTYTELIILEYRDRTDLADAKYDGKVNMQDVTQIELVILGRELELTVSMYTRGTAGSADITEVPVTISKPVERIFPTPSDVVSVMRSLKLEKDRIVGITSRVKGGDAYFPEFSELPCIGTRPMDYEAILNLHPDLVIVGTSSLEKHAEKLPGVTVVAFDCWRPETHVDEIRRLGYIIDKEDEALEYIDFYSGVMDTIKDAVDEIPEADRPKVYFESRSPYGTGGEGSGYHAKVTAAGGNNIFGDLSGYPKVDAEEVIKRNPEIIVKKPGSSGADSYYLGADITELTDAITEIINRPELAKVEAVKDERVYAVHGSPIEGARHFVGIAYMAKWFHPELFEELDPDAIHQEYITEYQELPDDFLDTHGVFVYPPFEES
ncbi:MAG: ABC transporter substrate-binding protein [Euryarchaeota archaeon]|nr:ABC transporter substrate-binding protein [Euryarchaeota archaeon]